MGFPLKGVAFTLSGDFFNNPLRVRYIAGMFTGASDFPKVVSARSGERPRTGAGACPYAPNFFSRKHFTFRAGAEARPYAMRQSLHFKENFHPAPGENRPPRTGRATKPKS